MSYPNTKDVLWTLILYGFFSIQEHTVVHWNNSRKRSHTSIVFSFVSKKYSFCINELNLTKTPRGSCEVSFVTRGTRGQKGNTTYFSRWWLACRMVLQWDREKHGKTTNGFSVILQYRCAVKSLCLNGCLIKIIFTTKIMQKLARN